MFLVFKGFIRYNISDYQFSTYARYFEKLISYALECAHTCVYQGVRNFIFSVNFAYAVNG